MSETMSSSSKYQRLSLVFNTIFKNRLCPKNFPNRNAEAGTREHGHIAFFQPPGHSFHLNWLFVSASKNGKTKNNVILTLLGVQGRRYLVRLENVTNKPLTISNDAPGARVGTSTFGNFRNFPGNFRTWGKFPNFRFFSEISESLVFVQILPVFRSFFGYFWKTNRIFSYLECKIITKN